MAQTLSFCGKTLEVNAQQVKSFDKLSISAGVKTKTQTQDGVERTTQDGAQAVSISLTVRYSHALGADVYAEVSDWLRMLRSKQTGNLILAGKDILGVPFLLTKADVSSIRYTADMSAMTYAEVALTFIESVISRASSSGGGDDYGGGGGSGSGKSSTKASKSQTTSQTTGTLFDKIKSTFLDAAQKSGVTGTSNLGGVQGYNVNVTPAVKSVAAVTSAAKKAQSVTSRKIMMEK